MKSRDPKEILDFLRRQVALWNAGKKEEMFALYHKVVPGKMTIEYVGAPVLEGWAALDAMWEAHGNKVHIDQKEVMVTGNEAVCYHHNTTIGAGTPARPSIELYKFDGDDLQIRYFHAANL